MIKILISEDNRELKTSKRPHKGPLPHGYKPELDLMGECYAEQVYWFQQLICILRWTVEFVRVDVQIEVPLLSQYQASPQESHP